MGHWTDGVEAKVVASYQSVGKKAVSRTFRSEPGCACCALGALRLDNEPLEEVGRVLGSPNHQQTWEFVSGFDLRMEDKDPQISSCFETRSFQAGVRTAEAVINAGLRV